MTFGSNNDQFISLQQNWQSHYGTVDLIIVHLVTRDVKRSSNFQTSVLKFEFKFDLHTFGIEICPLFSLSNDRQLMIQ